MRKADKSEFLNYLQEIHRSSFGTRQYIKIIVFNLYRDGSLKAETREGRENVIRVSVTDSTLIYSSFKKFLRYNDNKTEVFSLIADKVPKFTENISTTVICTKLSDITSNLKNDLSSFFLATTKKQTL